MPTSDDLRQRAAKLRAEADEHERLAAVNRGDAARLEETADRLDRAAEEALSKAGLPSGTDDGTVMPMMARESGGEAWSSVPGRAPSGNDAVSRAARSMGIGIRAIARKLKIAEGTLLKQVARNRVPQDVADAARKLAADFAAGKKR